MLVGHPEIEIPLWLRGLLQQLGIDVIDEEFDVPAADESPVTVSPEVSAQVHRHYEQQKSEARQGRGWSFGNAGRSRSPSPPQNPGERVPLRQDGTAFGNPPQTIHRPPLAQQPYGYPAGQTLPPPPMGPVDSISMPTTGSSIPIPQPTICNRWNCNSLRSSYNSRNNNK